MRTSTPSSGTVTKMCSDGTPTKIQDLPVKVRDRTFDKDTIKRMLDFMYDGEYGMHLDGT
jgi:hypothetical protein